MSKRLKWLVAILIFAVYFFICYRTLDPDFGWQVRIGEIVLKSGIPKTDPFSFSMPHFPAIDHEWLTSVSLYLGNHYLGYFALAIIFALLATSAIVVSLFSLKAEPLVQLGAVIMAATVLSYFVGIRAQIIGWLLLAVLIRLVIDPKLWRRYCYFLPLLMLVWVNLHGSFPLLIFLTLAITIDSFFSDRYGRFGVNAIILVLTVLATAVNPYRWQLWVEIERSLSDRNLLVSINEWIPTFVVFRFIVIPMTALFILLLIRYWRQTKLSAKIISLALTVEMLTSQRNLPIWSLWASVAIVQYLVMLKDDLVTDQAIKILWQRMMVFFTLVIAFLAMIDLTIKLVGTIRYQTSKEYPVAAAQYLAKNDHNQKVFNPYDWGGYLIWQAPQNKYFIDGRMPSWRTSTSVEGDSTWVFKDYQNVLAGKVELKDFIGRYQFELAILPKRADFNQLTEKFEQLGWKKAYQDDTSVILTP